MRYLRIFLLFLQHVTEFRMRAFVWIMPSLVNCLLPIVFWQAAMSGKAQINGWGMNSIASYYLFLTVANILLASYVESEVANEDIRQGDLARFLLQPIPYYWVRAFSEIAYKLLQVVYATTMIILFILLGNNFLKLNISFLNLLLSSIVFILAYFISYTYKLCLGFTAFWLKQAKSLHSMFEIVAIVLGGIVAPVQMFPSFLQNIAYATPFPYMTYFPIMCLISKLPVEAILKVISFQLFWLSFLLIINRYMWNKGLKVFTAVGR